MGKEFWLGDPGGVKYKPPPYDTSGLRGLGRKAGQFSDEWGGRMTGEAGDVMGRDQGAYWGEKQRAFGKQLLSAASGEAPSQAEQLMKAGLGRSQAAAQSMAASARGMSPGLARFLAGRQMGEQQASVTGQMGALRADEMARARDAYSQFVSGARGQDLATQQMQEQLRQQYLSMGMTAEQAELAVLADVERQKQSAWATQQGIAAGSYQPGTPGLLGNLLAAGAYGGAMALSDKREKKDIKKASPEAIEKFADALAGYSFSYKEDAPTSERSKKKKHWGVMAQDLEGKGGEVGKSVVETYTEPSMPAQPARPAQKGKDVKMLDTQATLGAALAAIGNLHGRLKKVEA